MSFDYKDISKTNKLPIKIWLNNIKDIESDCLEQINNLSNFPYAFHHIAIMPDTHTGYGMPIGGVMAVRDVVIPNAVGVDIGCGMCAVKTLVNDINKDSLKNIMQKIRVCIPLGFNHHKTKQDENLMPDKSKIDFENSIINKEYNSALMQIGTLGGGNHFIEIQKDEDGFIWIMIHSGSRNIGYKTANYYNELAIKLNEKMKSSVPKKWGLAFLSMDSKEGRNYLIEMDYCINFAFASRKLMMDRVCDIFLKNFKNIKFERMINIAHNYASLETHFDEQVMVHRKGATFAGKDTIGIIPGSQGTSSYIVRGKGNSESFSSCSHGAGRVMSRTKAQKELNLKNEIDKLNSLGVIHSIRNKKDLDEASSAYKDIEDVIANQEDLIEVLVKLKPLAVIKG